MLGWTPISSAKTIKQIAAIALLHDLTMVMQTSISSPTAGCGCPIRFRVVDGLPTADQHPPSPSALELVSRRTTLATTGAGTAVAAAAGTAPAAALVVDSSLALVKAPAQGPASPALATDPAGLLAEQLPASGGVVVVGPPRFQESCHPSDQYIRGLEDMTNAPLQRGR